MFNRLTRTLVKVVVASLIVGTILAHFGITVDELIKTTGFSSDRVTEYARAGFAWALPNLLLGAVVIVPLWFLIICSGRRARAAIEGHHWLGAPRAPVSFANSEARMTATPTIPTMMLHTALISGFTPSRTSE